IQIESLLGDQMNRYSITAECVQDDQPITRVRGLLQLKSCISQDNLEFDLRAITNIGEEASITCHINYIWIDFVERPLLILLCMRHCCAYSEADNRYVLGCE